MPNNIHYNYMQQIQQQLPPPSHSSSYIYQQNNNNNTPTHRHHHHHHHRHRQHSSHHLPPISQSQSTTSYTNHQYQVSTEPTEPTGQSSAYFLDRFDLENYTTPTLKQTVENILSKTKSKGLKVKLSLPDDGLIIDNIPDPSQSWIFKKSELLYFWRDPSYLNIIIVITANRSRNHSTRPYSASVFRLRGNNSAQAFILRAQQFFANLSVSTSTSNISKSTRNRSTERLNTKESRNSSLTNNHRTKTKSLPVNNEQPSSTLKIPINQQQSITTHRLIPAEFDPSKIKIESNDNNTNKNRTYSDTASSTDSQTSNLSKEIISYTRKMNNDEDDKTTLINKNNNNNNNLSNDQVSDLLRELKELRNEIAALKLEKRTPSVMTRSMSTSPLAAHIEYSKKVLDSSISTSTSSPSFHEVTSQSEVDAETQTDFTSTITSRRRQLSKKNKKTMVGSGGLSGSTRKKSQQSTKRNGRTVSNSSSNTISDQERTSPKLSSQMNDSLNDPNRFPLQDQYQPVILAAPPRPVLIRNPNNLISSNDSTPYTMSNNNNNNQLLNSSSSEEGTLSHNISEKEAQQFLSTNIPSSNSDTHGPQVPIITASNTVYHPSLENSKPSNEHIYENVPILIQSNLNQQPYYDIPIINLDEQQQQQHQQNQSNGYVPYPNSQNGEPGSQQGQYLVSGQPSMSHSPPTGDNNSSESQLIPINTPQQKPQIIFTGRHRNQPIYFANHLTNPIFNVDKQLLINTIANQFGVDLNSPQLQQLLTNQHLFAARKRTFANMVWQLTPDEETALCSSPIAAATTQTDFIDIDTYESNNSSSRSILKATKRFRSTAKRRNITWNSSLD